MSIIILKCDEGRVIEKSKNNIREGVDYYWSAAKA